MTEELDTFFNKIRKSDAEDELKPKVEQHARVGRNGSACQRKSFQMLNVWSLKRRFQIPP